MIGSAAARHLARAGHRVTVIGPPEPADKAAHDGVFGSHYDEGRITRSLDPDLYWSDMSGASIARYAEIKDQSGVSFFMDCGAMLAGPQDGDYIQGVTKVRKTRKIVSDRYFGSVLEEAFPYFSFGDDTQAFYEPEAAGYISPRNLVKAQTVAAERAGARVVDAIALGITESSDRAMITTSAGEITADQVLVAAGGFANMVLPQPLPIVVYARTVSFFEMGADEVARLTGMPSLVLQIADGREHYLLPPIRYPDGKFYLKIGGEVRDVPLDGADDIKAWFKSGGSAEVGAAQKAALMELMPDLKYDAIHTEACITTFTADDRALISRQSDRISVAIAGCGRGAKCSDELGRLGAEQATLM